MGTVFALVAALCNSTIGIFSKFGINSSVDHTSLAFYRCFIAFIFITIYLLLKKDGIKNILKLKKIAWKIALSSFCGVFILYYFEIWSLTFTIIPVVSFLLYSSGIFAIVLGVVWLKEVLNKNKIIASFLVFTGIIFIFKGMFNGSIDLALHTKGGILAIVAGIGYSAFLVLTKKFNFPDSIVTLWWLFAFGTLYLFVPFIINGPMLPNARSIPHIFGLSLIPTMCGFYFTNKALSLTEASRVQVFEMSEPIFASFFALFFFQEMLSLNGFLGAFLILFGLIVLQFSSVAQQRIKEIRERQGV